MSQRSASFRRGAAPRCSAEAPARRRFLAGAGALALALGGGRSAQGGPAGATAVDPDLLARALELLEQAPLIDAHNDLPTMLIEANGGDLTTFDLAKRQPALCADLPALRAGRVGAQYWSVFVESATQRSHVALHEAVREFDVALRMIQGQPGFEQARTADDIERIHRSGQVACLIGVEGGHMIENSPAVLRIFHQLGARYLTLTHWDNIDWADAATDRTEHFGLTPLGRQLVREMNRLGMFVDLSHVSADTMRDALRESRAPVIFSHSNAHALNPHPRNAPDDVLDALRTNGGVIHINFIRAFVSPDGRAWEQRRDAARRELRARLGDEEAVKQALERWEASVGAAQAGIAEVADHIDHVRRIAGIDHIGIGADFYRVDPKEMASGLGDVSRYPWLFAELLRRGYSDEDLLKIAGRNHLRAMRTMEQVAAGLQAREAPLITEGVKHPA